LAKKLVCHRGCVIFNGIHDSNCFTRALHWTTDGKSSPSLSSGTWRDGTINAKLDSTTVKTKRHARQTWICTWPRYTTIPFYGADVKGATGVATVKLCERRQFYPRTMEILAIPCCVAKVAGHLLIASRILDRSYSADNPPTVCFSRCVMLP